MKTAADLKLSEDLKATYERLVLYDDEQVTFGKVILSDENRYKIDQLLKEQAYKEKLLRNKLSPVNRVIMSGASGTGKTMLTKAIANYLDYPIIIIDIAKALKDNDILQNIADVFKISNAIGNCVVLLDECDSVAWKRDDASGTDRIARLATDSLLQHIDHMNKHNILVSCTNMLDKIDEAYIRRFDIQMIFTKPEKKLSEYIHYFMHKQFKLVDDADETLVEVVENRLRQNSHVSFYGIKNLVEKAMKRAVMSDTNVVTTSSIYKDLAVELNMQIRVDV